MPINSGFSALNLAEFRQQFPALTTKAYFNYGGQGPMSQVALDAIFQAFQYIQNAGPFAEEVNAWIGQKSQQTREAIAKELNVSPATITLTEDVTVGCNIGLWGINWQSGDRLLISDCEHPGIVAGIQEIQRRFGIEIDCCNLLETLNGGDLLEAIAKHLKPNTKLVVLSHVLWNTGQVLPLTEIVQACRQNSPETKVLIDAAQSVGMLPLNLAETGVDFYAFTGHKWLCGPEGVGGFYVNPETLESLNPTFIGWRGLAYTKEGLSWHPDGRRFEVATSAYPLYCGLTAAINIHQSVASPEERYQQICNLSKYLWEKLSELPDVNCLLNSPPESGLVSFQVSGVPHQELVQSLEKRGFLIRTLRSPNCVRACVHYFTLLSEIDLLVEEVGNFNRR
jgi:L-cysteine/cystine lyase